MTKAEKIAIVCDYIRAQNDPAGYINDEVGIPHVPMGAELAKSAAHAWLDVAEAHNFAALGEVFVDQLIGAYLQKAIDAKHRRAA